MSEKIEEVTGASGLNKSADPVGGKMPKRPADGNSAPEAMGHLDTKNGPSSKYEIITYLMNRVVGMSFEEMKAVYDSLAATQKAGDATYGGGANGTAAAASIKMHKEEFDAILAGDETFTEEFKSKAATIFEAVLKTTTDAITVKIEEENEAKLAEAVEATKTELSEKVNDFVTALAEKFVESNKLAIESSIRSEAVESFMQGLKGLFAEHYVSIPEDKVDVVEALSTEVDELEAKHNEAIAETVALRKKIREFEAKEVLEAALDGLADTQKDKVRKLAEAVEVTTIEEYTAKVKTLSEAVVSPSSKAPSQDQLNEEIEPVSPEKKDVAIDPFMASVIAAAKRSQFK